MKHFSTRNHPQANGQVEAVNKIIKHTLKTSLDELKRAWTEELPSVLWSYRTICRSSTGETPFLLAFGTEAIIPIDLDLPSFRVRTFNENHNGDAMRAERPTRGKEVEERIKKYNLQTEKYKVLQQ
ncbi:Uncharacterized protein Adt_13977 [Abeliophyllum distichum]|uniref:Integrase catalytic domain-containing protein n=1 Tax=Abeliophyllum distichum TaxID=126358 RepID=A0ABD1TZ81_9LAMI